MTRGNKRPMGPTAKLTLDLRASIHNRFDVEVLDAATGEMKQKARAYNVICNGLWDRLLSGTSSTWSSQSYFNYILFGSGSGTPAVSDTVLFQKIGAIQLASNESVFSTNFDRKNGVASAQAVATLNAADYVGQTITEVGIGYTDTNLATHALLQDMNGNPISITKTDTDVIKIYATVFLHWPDGGWYGGSINVIGQLRTITGDAGAYGFINVLLGRSYRSVGNIGIYNVSTRNGEWSLLRIYGSVTMSRANKTITVTRRIDAGAGNVPIRAFDIYTNTRETPGYSSNFLLILHGSWFTPPAITAEAVGTGTGSRTGFATAFPIKTGSKVYVDGVEASGVTMRPGPADVSNLKPWMLTLTGNWSGNALSASGTPLYQEDGYPDPFNDGAYYITLPVDYYTYAIENPFASGLGIATVMVRLRENQTRTVQLLASDDLSTWATIGSVSAYDDGYHAIEVPAAHRNKKYWVLKNVSSSYITFSVYFVGDAADRASNIIFDTPPASGSVITADYTPDCIAKDENHVFDLNLVLTLGEYQEV